MILLASSDPAFARDCARRLAAASHRTVTVATAAEALAQIARLRFDVVMVDGDLPDRPLLASLDGKTPTITLLNRKSIDDVLAAVDAIAPVDPPLYNRA